MGNIARRLADALASQIDILDREGLHSVALAAKREANSLRLLAELDAA